MTGAKPGVQYKFNLVNLVKKESLVNTGMSPLVAHGLDGAPCPLVLYKHAPVSRAVHLRLS